MVITPQTVPRSHGVPRPVSEPSSEAASAKPMEMPAPTEAAMPTRKVSQVLWVAKAAANSGASVETEPSISPARPGCTYCSRNIRRAVSSSAARSDLVRSFSLELVRQVLVLGLDLGQLQQQLAHRGVARRVGGLAIEPLRLELHVLGVLAHLVEAERPRQPQRLDA